MSDFIREVVSYIDLFKKLHRAEKGVHPLKVRYGGDPAQYVSVLAYK